MQKFVSSVVGPLATAVVLAAAYLLIFPWDLRPVPVPGTTTEADPMTPGMGVSFLAITCVVAAIAAVVFKTPVWIVAVASSVPATCLFITSCLNTDWPDAPLWPVDVPFVAMVLAGGSAVTAWAAQRMLGRGRPESD